MMDQLRRTLFLLVLFLATMTMMSDGSVWPKPQRQRDQGGFLIVRPAAFRFKVPCLPTHPDTYTPIHSLRFIFPKKLFKSGIFLFHSLPISMKLHIHLHIYLFIYVQVLNSLYYNCYYYFFGCIIFCVKHEQKYIYIYIFSVCVSGYPR